MTLKQPNKPYFPPVWSLSVAVLGVFCIVFLAEDAFSWGVPGKAASGSGQGPGGGARSGSAPAPFGFMFLLLGTGIASIFIKKLKSHLIPQAPAFLVLLAGALIDDMAPLYTFLLSVPLVACALQNPFKTERHQHFSHLIMALFIACILSPLSMVWTPYFMILTVLIVIFQTSMRKASKLLLATCVALSLCTLQPYAQPLDGMLQFVATTATTSILLMCGFAVEQYGNTIVGLETTLNITKACVGSEIIATTSMLVAFLGVMFIPVKKQLQFFIKLSVIAIVLNMARIFVVALLSHYLLHIDFAHIHWHAGWVVALLTYGIMALMTLQWQKSIKDCAGNGS
jgi:exosortase/archaeosortase family protein